MTPSTPGRRALPSPWRRGSREPAAWPRRALGGPQKARLPYRADRAGTAPRRAVRAGCRESRGIRSVAVWSSSRPSRPAAIRVTGQPRLWRSSGSIPHERRHFPNHRAFRAGHRPATLLLDPMRFQHCISDDPQCRNTASAPLIQARRPDPASTITISWRLDGFRRPPHRDQIAIGRRIFPVSASRGFLPWTLSDDGPSACRTVAIGRRPKPFTQYGFTAMRCLERSITSCERAPASLEEPRGL